MQLKQDIKPNGGFFKKKDAPRRTWFDKSISAVLISFMLFPPPTLAQIRTLDDVRKASPIGAKRLVDVAQGCQAYSAVPNSHSEFFISWEGGCLDGLANGAGVQRLSAMGKVLSSVHGTYANGVFVLLEEGYVLRLGKIIQQFPEPLTGYFRERIAAIEDVPLWAQDIALAWPEAKDAWAAEVEIRITRFAAPKARAFEAKESKNEREELFADETKAIKNQKNGNREN